MGGPTPVKHPYDPRRVRAPGFPPLRQAHRMALPAAGSHVAPGWVAGGLLVAALLSTATVAGSAAGVAAAPGRAVGSAAVRSPAGAAPTRTSMAGPGSAVLVEIPGGVVRSTALVRRPTLMPLAGGRVAPVAIDLPARYEPSHTPRPVATPRPAATAAPKAAHVTATPPPGPKASRQPATTHRTAARATPVRAPAPAIAYRNRASGRATWGPFGGAVITRLPPGTPIRVCGRLGCWEGVSSGHGPSADGGNLVDLSPDVFRRICGPLGIGVGSIVLSWR